VSHVWCLVTTTYKANVCLRSQEISYMELANAPFVYSVGQSVIAVFSFLDYHFLLLL